MYNAHRGLMQPHQMPPTNRITDLLEQIRMEFETQASQLSSQAGRSQAYDQERDHFVRSQVSEMEMMRDRVMQLEAAHSNMKADYDKKVEQLTRDLEGRGGHAGPPQRHGAPHHPPPSLGHGPRDLFGQIMANGAQQLAAPPSEPHQPQGLPVHLNQNAGLNTGPQPPQHQPYPGPGASGYQGVSNGYSTQGPPPLNASPGPGKGARRPPPGNATPSQQQPPMPYPQSPRGGHGPTPPPGRHPHGPPAPAMRNVGNELGALKPDEMAPGYVKEGEDWHVVFNPTTPRVLDVDLVHTLQHSSVVCCVRFSKDGRYVATGCNRSAQIFDVETGELFAHLEDENADKEGDLYIRSVCFSPHGEYLATGAEDKCIRVWDIAARKIVHTFTGHDQDIYSLDFSLNGRLIASGSGDRTVKLWDLDTKAERITLVIEEGVTTVALSPDSSLVAAGSLDRSVRVWDTESGMRIENLEGPPTAGHTDSVYSVAFSPTGRELVSGSLDKTIKMWSLGEPGRGKNTGRCIRTFDGHSDFVLSVALTPKGEWVLSGSKDRGVVFWDPRTGIPQLHLQGHRNSVISVSPSPVPGMFATGSGDSRARIWRYSNFRGN